MKIDMYYPMGGAFGPQTHKTVGVGGTENFIINASRHLARLGHTVTVYNNRKSGALGEEGTLWRSTGLFYPFEERDVLWGFRAKEVFTDFGPLDGTKLTALYLADTESHGLGQLVHDECLDLAMFVGKWQAEKIMEEEELAPKNVMITSNGVVMHEFNEARARVERVPGKCVHMATPERGTEPLLDLWPVIQAQVPTAELHLYSSFLGWMMSPEDDARMSEALYDRVRDMQGAGMKIINHKHGSADEIQNALASARLYLYPTRWFDETNCMCVLEASAAGTPSIVTGRAALLERVVSGTTGYVIEDGTFHDNDFAANTIRLLEDDRTWRWMSKASIEKAWPYDYEVLAESWVERWGHEIALRR